MEAIANAAEDRLIDSLSFKLKNSANYVTDRRSVSFFPQGTILSAEKVFRATRCGYGIQKYKKVPKFGYFSISLVKSLSNTKWACSTL